jgi:hypothetical protein
MMRARWITGAALLALAACGRGGEAERQAAGGNVSVSGASGDITISTPNGTASIRTGGAIAGMPDGVPAYPNIVAGQNIDMNGGSGPGQGRILGFSTPDSPAQVIAFYAQAVAAGGYTVANQMDMGTASTLTARRGQQTFHIVATQAAGGTRVQIIVAAGAG